MLGLSVGLVTETIRFKVSISVSSLRLKIHSLVQREVYQGGSLQAAENEKIAKSPCLSVCRNQKRELGLATMLLCVVMVFFLCNFLALVVNILEVRMLYQYLILVFHIFWLLFGFQLVLENKINQVLTEIIGQTSKLG